MQGKMGLDRYVFIKYVCYGIFMAVLGVTMLVSTTLKNMGVTLEKSTAGFLAMVFAVVTAVVLLFIWYPHWLKLNNKVESGDELSDANLNRAYKLAAEVFSSFLSIIVILSFAYWLFTQRSSSENAKFLAELKLVDYLMPIVAFLCGFFDLLVGVFYKKVDEE